MSIVSASGTIRVSGLATDFLSGAITSGNGSGNQPPPGFPPLNTLAAINLNTVASLNPCPGDQCPWSGPPAGGGGQANVFLAWNSGIFSDAYGTLGAYVVCGGGDADYFGSDAYLFSLDTLRWTRIGGIDGVGTPSSVSGFFGIDTMDRVNGEWPDGSMGMPHTYDSMIYLPPNMGGGPAGSLFLPQRAFIFGSGTNAESSGMSYRLDLSTGRWSRGSSNYCSQAHPSSFALDTTRNNVFGFQGGSSFINSIQFMSNFTAGGVGQHSDGFASSFSLGGQDPTMEYMAPLQAFIVYGKDADTNTYRLEAFDANTIFRTPLTVSGDALPNCTGVGLCYCPDTGLAGSLFLQSSLSSDSQFIWRIDPPPAGDYRTGTWTSTRITMAGASVFSVTNNGIWKRLRYARSVGCLIFCHARSEPVYAYRVAGVAARTGSLVKTLSPATLTGLANNGTTSVSINWQLAHYVAPAFNLNKSKHLDFGYIGGRWYQECGDHPQIDPTSPPDAQDGRQECLSFNVAANDWRQEQAYYVRNASPDAHSQIALPDDGCIAARNNEIWSFVSERVDQRSTAAVTAAARATHGSDIVIQDMANYGARDITTGAWTVKGARPFYMTGDRLWRMHYDSVTDKFIGPLDAGGLAFFVVNGATGANESWENGSGVVTGWGSNFSRCNVTGCPTDGRDMFIYDLDSGQIWAFNMDGIIARQGFGAARLICQLPTPIGVSSQSTWKMIFHPDIRAIVCFFDQLYVFRVDVGALQVFPIWQFQGFFDTDSVYVPSSTQFYDPITKDVVCIGGQDFNNGQGGPGYWRLTFTLS